MYNKYSVFALNQIIGDLSHYLSGSHVILKVLLMELMSETLEIK